MSHTLSNRRQFLTVTAAITAGTTAGCLTADGVSTDEEGSEDVVLSTELSGDESETFETGASTEYGVTAAPEGSQSAFQVRPETIPFTSTVLRETIDGESTFDLELKPEVSYEVTALGGTTALTIAERS